MSLRPVNQKMRNYGRTYASFSVTKRNSLINNSSTWPPQSEFVRGQPKNRCVHFYELGVKLKYGTVTWTNIREREGKKVARKRGRRRGGKAAATNSLRRRYTSLDSATVIPEMASIQNVINTQSDPFKTIVNYIDNWKRWLKKFINQFTRRNTRKDWNSSMATE